MSAHSRATFETSARRSSASGPTRDSTSTTASSATVRTGEVWQQIGTSYGITGEHVRRLTVARTEVTYRRWGQQPVADPQEVRRRRDDGQSIREIANALGCSLQAVRTALERTGRADTTRYPSLSTRRRPTAAELEHFSQLYEACPQAPRARPGARNVRGDEGRALAQACHALVDDGVPMLTLARDLGRGATWIHFLLECHDLRPIPHPIKSSANTRLRGDACRLTRAACDRGPRHPSRVTAGRRA